MLKYKACYKTPSAKKNIQTSFKKFRKFRLRWFFFFRKERILLSGDIFLINKKKPFSLSPLYVLCYVL